MEGGGEGDMLDVDMSIASGVKMAEFIQHVVYSEEDKIKFSKIIREFNELYYYMNKQTWSITTWRGVGVLKPPTDMWVYQELIYQIKPDLIIETGTFMGGSALFMRDVLNNVNSNGFIISIDIDHSKIDSKSRVDGITFYNGSSVDKDTIDFVKSVVYANACERVMVILDSDHERDHVLKEIELYAPLVSIGSILIIEDGNNHDGVREAVKEFGSCLVVGEAKFRKNLMCEKFMLTFNRDGYYEREK